MAAAVLGCGEPPVDPVRVIVEGRSVLARYDADVADEPAERAAGLRALPPLSAGRALLLAWPRALSGIGVSTAGLDQSIDVLFLDEDRSIRTIREQLPPDDPSVVASDGPTQFVLELPPGDVEVFEITLQSDVHFRLRESPR